MAAMAVSAALASAKGFVWLAGGSAALLASLVDSLIDFAVSTSNFFALRYAFMPADDDHRYGHGKAEGIAALAQSAFIVGSCVFVVLEAIRHIMEPSAPQAVYASVVVLGVGSIVTIALTMFQKAAAKKTGSLSTEADAAHYTGDVGVNIGVIISLLAAQYLGWWWADPVMAVTVTLWLIYTARGIGVKAVDMLLDRELDEPVRQDLMTIIRAVPGVQGLHDFRTRKSGIKLITSFDIEVDPNLTLFAAHEISRAVEAGILEKYAGAEVMIHIDPVGDITDSRHHKIRDFHAR